MSLDQQIADCDVCHHNVTSYSCVCDNCLQKNQDIRQDAEDRIQEILLALKFAINRYTGLNQDAHDDKFIPCPAPDGECMMCTEIRYLNACLDNSSNKESLKKVLDDFGSFEVEPV